MYARHYHQYNPAVQTNIMETYRKAGWTPPSEDPAILEKWRYYQDCAWRKEQDVGHGV
jgi:hypothetical protein